MQMVEHALRRAPGRRGGAPRGARRQDFFGGHTASVFPRELIATGKVDVVLLGDADFSIHALVREGRVSNGYSAADITRRFRPRRTSRRSTT